VSRAILDLVLQEQEVVISSDLGQDERVQPGQSLALYNIRSVVAAPLKLHDKLRGVLYLHRCGPLAFSKPDSDLVSALAALLASGLEQAELKTNVVDEKLRRKALERFHPPEIAERLCAGDQVSALQEHPASVVVFDIEGFAHLASKVEPRELARILHEYYEILYDKIFANGGSLVKLHDGWALALFGAPAATNREATWAVEAALSLCTEFSSLALLWPQVGKLALRCAVDTGSVVAGFVGPVDRLEYAAIGAPVVNATALARAGEGTSLLITEQTWRALPQKHYRVKEVALLPGQRAFWVARN
jgi:class 3 adenylate cyclase